jgi:hypothetical protein
VVMLVPTHNLSGWPAAPHPTVLQELGLLIGFPALAFIVVFAIAKIGTVAQAANAPAPVTDSVWVGGRKSGELESGTEHDAPSETAPDEAAQSGGGAGARW